MTLSQAPYQNLWKHLNNECQIVTVNLRLYQNLNKSMITENKIHQRISITSRKIYPLQSWLDQLLDSIFYHLPYPKKLPFFYNNQQTKRLWLSIIEADKKKYPDDVFLNSIEAASKAYDAYDRLTHWIIDSPYVSEYELNLDFKRFNRWLDQFNQHCQINDIYPDNEKLKVCLQLLEKIEKGLLILPFKRLIFAGFNDYSPLLMKLIQALQQHNIEVIHWQFEPKKSTTTQIPLKIEKASLPRANLLIKQFKNSHQELISVAQSVYEDFYQNPNQRIGIIVPDLNQIHQKIQLLIDDAFFPKHNRLDTLNAIDKPYAISGGIRLLSVPIIQTALQIIKLKPTTKIEMLIRIIESPYTYAKDSKKDQRYKLIQTIKKKCFKQDSIKTILPLLTADENLAELKKPLERIFKPFDSNKHQFELIFYLNEKLKSFYFPGEASLSSDDYQALAQFNCLFNELKSQANLFEVTNENALVKQLEYLASSIMFQPESNPNATISILGMLESGLHYFDKLYLIRMNDRLWPKMPNPNPLLPIHLQKKYQMPHASSERELYFSTQLTDAFFYQCQNLVVTYSAYDKEIKQDLSPLFNAFKKEIEIVDTITSLASFNHLQAVKFEKKPLSLKPLTKKISAQSYLYKRFLTCPFQAQMADRLKLESLSLFKKPLEPREKGNLIHQVMENIWITIKTSENLYQYTELELETLIDETLNHTLKKQTNLFPKRLNYLEKIEKNRIGELIKNFLLLEKQRNTLFKVLAHEKTVSISLGQLQSKLRIDRIDKLADGNQWLIDYKTSKSLKPNHWYGKDFSEPQLPLYALATPANGISFAQINDSQIALYSLSENECKIIYDFLSIDIQNQEITHLKPKTPTELDHLTWQDLKMQWQNQLNQIAADFSQGQLSLTDNKQHCRVCSFDKICHYQQLNFEDKK